MSRHVMLSCVFTHLPLWAAVFYYRTVALREPHSEANFTLFFCSATQNTKYSDFPLKRPSWRSLTFVWASLMKFDWNRNGNGTGISRDSRHKRRETGGKRSKYRKKRKFEMGRPAAMTKLGHKRVHPVRCRGGNMKYRALRLDTGNFSWGTEGTSEKCFVASFLTVSGNGRSPLITRTNHGCIFLFREPLRSESGIQFYWHHVSLEL